MVQYQSVANKMIARVCSHPSVLNSSQRRKPIAAGGTEHDRYCDITAFSRVQDTVITGREAVGIFCRGMTDECGRKKY